MNPSISIFDKAAVFLKLSRVKYRRLGISVNQRVAYLQFFTSWLFEILVLPILLFRFIFSPSRNAYLSSSGSIKFFEGRFYIQGQGFIEHDDLIILKNNGRGEVPLSFYFKHNVLPISPFIYLFQFAFNLFCFSRHRKTLSDAFTMRITFHLSKLFLLHSDIVYVISWNNPAFIGIILYCRSNNIIVNEVQHGIIHSNHPAYNSPCAIVKEISPQNLFYWFLGSDTHFLSRIYDYNSRFEVLSVSSKFLNRSSVNSAYLLVTLQDSNWRPFLEALQPFLQFINGKCDIIICPRSQTDTELFPLLNGIKYSINKEFYGSIGMYGVHISHSSTTLIESALCGMKTICFDFDGTSVERNPLILDFCTADNLRISSGLSNLIESFEAFYEAHS